MKTMLTIFLLMTSITALATIPDALKSDLAGTCADNFVEEDDRLIIYPYESPQTCLDTLADLIPGLRFTFATTSTPAHSGSIESAELRIISYQPARVPLSLRLEQISRASCVKKVFSANSSSGFRTLDDYAQKRIRERQSDLSRTVVVQFDSKKVTDWGNFRACMDEVAHLLPSSSFGRLPLGTPFVINGFPPYTVLRLLN